MAKTIDNGKKVFGRRVRLRTMHHRFRFRPAEALSLHRCDAFERAE